MANTTDAATVALYDAQVRAAWARHALSDGTKLNVGRIDEEQMFAITPTGTFPVVATRSGWQKCDDGSERRFTITNTRAIIPNAGGHTHPLGRDGSILADLPGPEDGKMAMATGKTAYVISRRRAFAISPNTFDVRVIAGAKFSKSDEDRIRALQVEWTRHTGGSGVQCHIVSG